MYLRKLYTLIKKRFNMKKGLLFILFLIFTFPLLSQTSFFWRTEATNGNWAGTSNWWNGGATAAGFGVLTFENNHETTMNNNTSGTLSTHQIRFNGGASSSRTISGNPVRLFDFSGGDPKIENFSTVLHTMSFNLEGDGDAGDPMEINPVNGDLTLSGTLNNRGSSINVYGSNSRTLRFNGIISGSGGLTLNSGSNNTVILAAANTYTGTTTVSGGTLRISATQSLVNLDLSGGGNLTIDAGATLTVTGTYTPGTGTINNQGTLVLQGAGNHNFPVATTVTNMNNLSISKSSGVVTLTSNLTISGVLTLSGGTLAVDTRTLTLNGGAIVTSGGTLTTTSNSSLSFGGSNTGPLTIPSSVVSLSNLTLDNSASARVDINSNLSIAGDLALNSGTLSIGANTLTLAGTVSRTSGFLRGGTSSNLAIQGGTAKTLHFDQSTDGSHVNPSTGTNAINNLTLSSSGNLVLGNKVNLYGVLTTATGTTLNSGDGLLVFRNTNGTTSRIADLSAGAGTITGTAISEIYMHAPRRAWRFITNPTPISGGTIANNWQSAFGFGSGYGTNIYGPVVANGLNSPATISASMMRFNSSLSTTGAYDNVTNTNVDLDGTYFVFVRGDKSVVAIQNGTSPWVQTTLASKGTIKTGVQTVSLNGLNGRYGAIPNPYLSPVDVKELTYTGIAGNNASYHWNPNKGGTSFGGWVSINSDTWDGISDFRRYMQTGQSALVLMNSATASVVFNENDKATDKTTQQTGAGNGLSDKLLTSLVHVDANGIKENVDELYVIFKSNANANFDGNEDAVKMSNSGENLSSKRNNTLIAIEARPYIQNHDSIFMSFTNTRVANYEFEFDPSNFDATVLDAKLVDKFLNTETPISLSAKTTVPFSVTATTGSNAADRFMIVFRGTGALPNKGFTVTGEKLGTNKVKVNWEAQAETGVREYALEKSTDGVNYQTVNTQAAKNGNVANSYTYTDNSPVNGVNYYRVKTTQHNDIERYSTVITVNFKQQSTNNVTVYPNPVKGNTIGLQLQDLEKGMYSVRILSIEGKEVYKQQLQVNGSSLNTTINPSTKLAQGTYTLQVVGKSTTYTQKVVVE